MSGIHHVTAISGNAARNVDFYTRMLGLRLVKKTVNFDDPGTYHLYYGDEQGRPGTILTFFPWEHAAPGRNGVGQAEETAFRIPTGSIGYWTQRLIEKGVPHQAPEKRFGEPVLAFTDPDGMSLALVGVAGAAGEPAWSDGGIAAEHAIRGFHGVTLMLDKAAPTGCDPHQCARLRRDRARRSARALRGRRRARQRGDHPRDRRLPAGPHGPRLGASHRVPRRATTRSRPRWPRRCATITACRRPSSSTATTSARCISASRAASCSRSRPTSRALRSTSRSQTSGAPSSCRRSSSRAAARSRRCCRRSTPGERAA